MTKRFEDLRQSGEWSRYISQLGWQIEKLGEVKIFIRKLYLVGSVAKIQRSSVIPPIEEIDQIAKKYRALFVKIEPGLNEELGIRTSRFAQEPCIRTSSKVMNEGWEADAWPLVPTRTIHIDLSQNEEDIFENFSKDARYSIRRAGRNGVSVCHSERSEESLTNVRISNKLRDPSSPLAPQDDNLELFYNLLKETGKRKKFWVAPFKDLKAKVEAFENKSALILAYHNSKLVAGALILFHDRVAYYHHAASSPKGRKLLAPYLVVWEAIKLAKKKGCHTLDLEGIYDPRYKIYKRFRSIGVFKKKFGGEEVEYPGSFIRYYNPIIKLIFKLTSWR